VTDKELLFFHILMRLFKRINLGHSGEETIAVLCVNSLSLYPLQRLVHNVSPSPLGSYSPQGRRDNPAIRDIYSVIPGVMGILMVSTMTSVCMTMTTS